MQDSTESQHPISQNSDLFSIHEKSENNNYEKPASITRKKPDHPSHSSRPTKTIFHNLSLKKKMDTLYPTKTPYYIDLDCLANILADCLATGLLGD